MFMMLVLMSAMRALSVGEHALAVLDLHGQPHGVGRDVAALVPLDVDAPLGVVLQVDDVRAGRRVHRHALAARDVADDASRRESDCSTARGTPSGRRRRCTLMRSSLRPAPSTRLTAETTGCSGAFSLSCSCGTSLSSTCFAATACRSRAARSSSSTFWQPSSTAAFASASPSSSFLTLRSKRRASFSSSFRPSSIARVLLLGLDQVLDLVARARRADEVQPVAARLVARRW